MFVFFRHSWNKILGTPSRKMLIPGAVPDLNLNISVPDFNDNSYRSYDKIRRTEGSVNTSAPVNISDTVNISFTEGFTLEMTAHALLPRLFKVG